MNPSKVLIIDDEPLICNLITHVLRSEGFEHIQTASSGMEAIAKCQSFNPNIMVLDIMLPDMEGFEVCRQCREISQAPILFLTARRSDLDKLIGFEIGGDDYILKPFNPLEVAARIKAHLRRAALTTNPVTTEGHVYDFHRFQVDERSAELIVNGTTMVCPAREFQLLAFFCKNPNRVFSRKQLYEQVWGETSLGDDNTVMVHVRRLREKIEIDPAEPKYLVTVRGLGYKLVSQQTEN
ncbi:response regulator transcription factor [Alicyclobacillus fodiniaquatilis]|uniref:Response regulator transcription factor n=1 Tax=Alicyclobacillus fodiniaquatilis TaxID=1661150 RepID=A0ABW4JNH9_9BACL